jgi:hypothetical protein
MLARSRQVFWGLLLVGSGALFLLFNLGGLHASAASLWPLLVLLFGVWLVVESLQRPGARGLTAAVVILAIGAFWFAEEQGWIRAEQFLAVLLMAMGAGLLGRVFFERPR